MKKVVLLVLAATLSVAMNAQLVNGADNRLRTNVKSLSETMPNALEIVLGMTPVQYNIANRIIGENTDGTPMYMYQGDEEGFLNTHFGFIAEEFQQILPNLVYHVDDTHLGISITELIPVLVTAIQNLKDELRETRKAAGIGDENVTPVEAIAMRGLTTELFQNMPNPFTENTVIPCSVAEGVANAMIYIYDLSGKQIDQYPVEGRGKTSVTISARSLDAGMYLYSLIADGNVVDTKRMILTK